MAKQSGLGDDFLFAGYHIGDDIQTVDVKGGTKPLDVTPITKSAFQRLGGLRDGSIDVVAFMDPAAGMEHAAFSGLSLADQIGTYLRGQAIGSPAACCVARQANYDPTRAADGMLTFKATADGDGYGVEWGEQLTAGVRTDTAATNGTTQDDGAGYATPAVPASGTPVTNTSPLPAQVVISGGTVSNVVVNGVSVLTGDGTCTVPAGQSITLTYSVAPTWTWTLQTAYGAQGYLQAVAFTGTDATVEIQHSADGSTWSTLLSFTQITGAAPLAQRVATAATVTVGRYVRATTVTTGGFTNLEFAVVLCRNVVATVF